MRVWLHTNRRVFLLSLLVPCLLVAASAAAMVAAARAGAWWGVALAALPGLAGLLAGVVIGRFAYLPRMAFDGRHLCLYLRFGSPVRVPIEVVEGFLLGTAPTELPGSLRRAETSTLVVRLAERAESWARVDIEPLFGSWCNHYVTIRGNWCEPLDVRLAQRLNEQLAAAQAKLSAASAASPSAGTS